MNLRISQQVLFICFGFYLTNCQSKIKQNRRKNNSLPSSQTHRKDLNTSKTISFTKRNSTEALER